MRGREVKVHSLDGARKKRKESSRLKDRGRGNHDEPHEGRGATLIIHRTQKMGVHLSGCRESK